MLLSGDNANATTYDALKDGEGAYRETEKHDSADTAQNTSNHRASRQEQSTESKDAIRAQNTSNRRATRGFEGGDSVRILGTRGKWWRIRSF